MNKQLETSELRYRVPTPEEDQVIIAVNPNAGAKDQAEKVEQLVAELQQANLQTEVIYDLEEVVRRTHEASSQGKLRALVGAGGDGTIAELLNRTEPGVPLVMLPLGTENLLAKYLQLTGRAKQVAKKVAEVIIHGVAVRLDAGRANDRLFLLMVSCGVDAEVIQRLHDTRDGHINHLSYFKPSLAAALNYKYPQMTITCYDDKQQPLEKQTFTARWTHIVNLPCYALGIKFAPAACGTDQLFDLAMFKSAGFWNTIGYYLRTKLRLHRCFPKIQTARATHIRIESDEPLPYQIDGDPGGVLPLEVELLPERLTLMVTRSWARRHGIEQ